jgi:hypothetical protein
VVDAPTPYPVGTPRRRGRPHTATDTSIEDAAIIGALSVAISSMFIPPAMALGEHWLIDEAQSNYLADLAHKALSTTGSRYGSIRKYLEKYTPWVALTIGFAQVVGPKWEETQRLRAAKAGDFSGVATGENFGDVGPASQWGQVPDRPYPTDGATDAFKSFPGAD